MRQCADCGHRATDRARFCERCGAPLRPSATPLRAPRTLEAKILDERTAIEGERKQVTVMYTDIVGSMQLTDLLDGERWGLILDRFLAIAARAVHAFEGTVNQFTGDGLMAVFGAPLAHEDHARRACLAVLELQREVAGLAAEVARVDGAEFAVRCGLNSGEVVVGAIGDDVHMDFVPIGNTTALGKRIESLAPPGSSAISAATAALIGGEFVLRELGEFAVKGSARRQRVLELVGPGTARTRLAAMAATRGLSPFTGRRAERAMLDAALERTLAGDGRAVGIVGDAGIGKSRLVHEFAADCVARGVSVSATSGIAHGRFVPLLPVLALLRDSFGVAEHDPPDVARARIEATMLGLDPAFAADLPLLFDFLGVGDPDRPALPLDPEAHQHQLLRVVTRMVASRAGSGAAVLVVEDLHWLDDASAAFLEQLAEAVVGSRTLLVATHRPEHDALWAIEEPHVQISLDPLDADATDALLGALLGRDRSLAGLATLIDARAGGNPFFVEEIVQALAENGHLAGARGTYELADGLEGLVLPPTVQAGLAARIDRLSPREKALLQTMSVIGTEIPGPLLRTVAGLDEGELADAVTVLADAQWVVARGPRGQYGFKHPLTQEVAYASQLSERRARAHRAVAAAIERTYPGGLDERAALIAHHAEAAGDTLAAAAWHARAAAWAETPSPADCMRHWRRVRALTDGLDPAPERDALRTRAGLGILSVSWRLGISPQEITAIHAETQVDLERFRGNLYYAGSLMHGRREREGLDGFREASREAVAAGDPGRMLTASTGVAYASWIAGSLTEAVETLDRALAVAGDDPTTGAGVGFVCPLAHALQSRGLSVGHMDELETALRDFDRGIVLAREHRDPQTESACHANRSLLEVNAGRTVAALRGAALGLAIAEPAGDTVHVIACSTPMAAAQAAMGRFAEALARAEANLATIREHGIGLYYEPLLLATIARSRLGLGEPDAALAAAEEGAGIASARGLTTCALPAPIALAQVLRATQGAAAGERIDAVLAGALRVARQSRARLFERQIGSDLAALASARDGDRP
ncbi:Adenylate cyclase [Patulibacter medicamentivorans]|uniref:Adenylate cyclase n=1 Tax=Patulibacter medicamentivorans TaxID=1097667 RepID=H0E0D2_9ACTN|nr:adenylate/guanylate cyclase domain-containing protein [Patulibacter medicamentivorans]EHN12935.1 Adenylate cyclase [Patulibacter medicamentivorans]